MKKFIFSLACILIMFGCEQERKAPVAIDEVTVTIRFDAEQECPKNTNCTNLYIRDDGSVVYDQPIIIHLSKSDPYQCVAHELSHVIEGQWHKGESKACYQLP